MQIDSFRASYDFYPIQNGALTTGSVRIADSIGSTCRWVFDCSVASARDALEHTVEKFAGDLKGESIFKPVIDLVVLPTINRDRLGGLMILLRHFRIKNLIIPYASLPHRLAIAFGDFGGLRDGFTHFAVNPVRFILSVRGADVERIVFALPNQRGLAHYHDDTNLVARDVNGKVQPSSIEVGQATGLFECEVFRRSVIGTGITLGYLPRGSSLRFLSVWEFLPINSTDDEQRADPSFYERVESHHSSILTLPTGKELDAILFDLKARYDSGYGSAESRRHYASLFLHTGPSDFDGILWERKGPSTGAPDLPDVREPKHLLPGNGSVFYTGSNFRQFSDDLFRVREMLGVSRNLRLSAVQATPDTLKLKSLRERLSSGFSLFECFYGISGSDDLRIEALCRREFVVGNTQRPARSTGVAFSSTTFHYKRKSQALPEAMMEESTN